MRLENKVAFISGGSRGMGAAEARLFAQEGAKVVIGDILDDDGRQTAAAINELDSECLYVHLDVKSETSWASAISETVNRFGKLDILVNNAGVASFFMVEELSVNEWDRVMDINAKGVFLGTKAAIPEMRRAGGGSIINISSISGFAGQSYVSAAYNASKGAVRIFTKSTAIQYASESIRVNSVHPGPIDTPMTAFREDDPSATAASIARIPLGRSGVPDDVAYGVLYLASDESSFVTGSELIIDGGYLAQ